jgi:N-acetylneuraminic acid mutarotase
MVIFGGFVNGERSNEIYRYYFKENRWERVKPIGRDQPNPRAGHSCVLINDSMIIFGGKDEDNNKLNDVWEFDLASYQWNELKI